MKKAFICAAVAWALPVLANADVYKDVVMDEHGGYVRNSFGDCVRTQWSTHEDKCGGCKHHHCKEHHLAYVFFDFNKWNLRHEAYATVHKLYKKLHGEQKKVMFKIVGHTDTVGKDQYNMHLSMRRAEIVKQELVQLGIPAAHIKVQADGYHHLMVKTPKGVAEVKNRRAEIFYSIETE
jgi:outer membrane protein OmpA-like peptidoglycan-associated protein